MKGDIHPSPLYSTVDLGKALFYSLLRLSSFLGILDPLLVLVISYILFLFFIEERFIHCGAYQISSHVCPYNNFHALLHTTTRS
jgi:hypothetical protein